MTIRKTIFMCSLIILSLVYVGIVQANTINGSLWHVPEAVVNNANGAIPANVPGTTPDVTFTVDSPFNFNATNATVGAWLASSSATILTGTAATLASLMDNSTTGTILNFTGFVTVVNGQQFTVTHDDGLTLIIGGLTVVNVPGPTAPQVTTVTYGGPSGNFPFQLVYSECCQGPAQLQISLPLSTTAAPEPATMLLLGLGLVGLAGVRRKFKQ